MIRKDTVATPLSGFLQAWWIRQIARYIEEAPQAYQCVVAASL